VSGCGTGSTVNCAEPYPAFQSITGNLYETVSNYNSLQAVITKRLANGFSFSFNYVWSHMLDDADSSGWGSHAGPQAYQIPSTLTSNEASKNYGPSNFDVRNAFKGYAIYELPFGKGRPFLNQNGFVDSVFGGWQIAGTIVDIAGNPFQITAPADSYEPGSTEYPNRVPGVNTKAPNRNPRNGLWYNPAAFSNPANGTFGDMGRNPLVGPGVNYVNLSGGKSFSLPWEGIAFAIRADASNAFNHPSFANPVFGSSQTQLVAPGADGIFTGPSTGQITTVSEGGRGLQLSGRLSF